MTGPPASSVFGRPEMSSVATSGTAEEIGGETQFTSPFQRALNSGKCSLEELLELFWAEELARVKALPVASDQGWCLPPILYHFAIFHMLFTRLQES